MSSAIAASGHCALVKTRHSEVRKGAGSRNATRHQNPLCTHPYVRYHCTFLQPTHIIPPTLTVDVQVGSAGSHYGASLWLPVTGGSLADLGGVCVRNRLTVFHVSSGEKKTLELKCCSSQNLACSMGLTGKHRPGNAERGSRQALGGT